MTFSAAIAGATGYAGGEILRLLLSHPLYLNGQLEIGALTARSSAGLKAAHALPHIPQLADRLIAETTPANLSGHDIVFLALPHGHSAEIAASLPEDVLVIDCGADFRLKREKDWHDFYDGPYPGSWPYGIPEMPGHRQALTSAKRVAIPGCFPTAITLGAMPAVAKGLIEPEFSVIAVTGVSGAGKKADASLLGAETMGSLRAYKPGRQHRHTPEVIQNLAELSGAEVKLTFTPVLAPLTRGILATITAPLAGDISQAQIDGAYREFYASEPFCHVLPDGLQPATQNVVGSNAVHLQAHVDERARRLVMTAALDNLTKGTAGAAIQCMNIALHLPETSGLASAAVAP